MAKRILALFILPVLLLIQTAPASATVYGFSFEPTSGGPGTVVTVSGVVPRSEITVELGTADIPTYPVPPAYVTNYQPKVILGRVMPDLTNSCCEVPFTTTVKIPNYWPDGKPITESTLGIVIKDTSGNLIPETTSRLFTFVRSRLPIGGEQSYFGAVVTVVACVLATVAGLLLRRRASRLEAVS